jgi:hypothetical protein
MKRNVQIFGSSTCLEQTEKEHIQLIIDRMADQLSGWKADLLTRVGRKVHMQFVLTSMLIYLAMALDLPQWAYKALTKSVKIIIGEGTRKRKETSVS